MLIRKSFLIIFLACTGLTACNDDYSIGLSLGKKTYGDFVLNYNNVYCGKDLIQQANASQFEFIGSHYINSETIYYARDKQHVYTCDVRRPTILSPAKAHQTIQVTLEGIDPASFVLLEDGYARDARTVLYGNEIVVGANADNFKILKNSYQSYGLDGKYIYHGSKKLPVKYPESFRLLGGIFATDNYHVYADRTRISINPAKAVVLTYRLIRDDKHVYYLNKQIKGAHACSFAPGGEAEDSMDKDHFYYQEDRWDLSRDSEHYQLKRKAHAQWKAYYAEYRKTNKDGCPAKRVLIPRHQGEIEIADIPAVK